MESENVTRWSFLRNYVDLEFKKPQTAGYDFNVESYNGSFNLDETGTIIYKREQVVRVLEGIERMYLEGTGNWSDLRIVQEKLQIKSIRRKGLGWNRKKTLEKNFKKRYELGLGSELDIDEKSEKYYNQNSIY